MARKSRKNRNTEGIELNISAAVVEESTCLSTAAYVRLSVDKGDDNSIENQKMLIQQFLENHLDLHLEEVYVDDGYTGSNFNRPAFIRMLEDIKTGKIQCVVVKDLSRFGRNFIETGYYIETIFTNLNVRFISINDDFDNSREADRNNLSVPIKNMINDYYAKDFSKKQTVLYELHSQRGDAKILRSIYGYIIDKERNVLVPNPETAPIVRIIFRWFLMGEGLTEIARRLNELGVMTPLCYKYTYEEHKKVPENDCWRPDRVRTILRNEAYNGDTVYGKRRKMLYKNIAAYHTKPEEWVIHKNTHESLVLPGDYEKVQKMCDDSKQFILERRAALKENREEFPDSFPQKIRCKECGNTMLYCRYAPSVYRSGLMGADYTCKGDDRRTGCRKKVNADYLRITVMDQLQMMISTLCERKVFLEKMKSRAYDKGALVVAERKLQNLKYQLEKSEEKRNGLYEDKVQGVIDDTEYRDLKEHYIEKKQKLEKDIEDAVEHKKKVEQSLDFLLDFEKHLESYLGDKTFRQELVDELIDTIVIDKDGNMEIRFKCEELFVQIAELMEGSDEE